MSKEIDVDCTCILVVLTKLDIMNKGTDSRKALMIQEIHLKFGCSGEKNRSKLDLIDKSPMKEAFGKENNSSLIILYINVWALVTMVQLC